MWRANPRGATCRQYPHVIESSVLGIARIGESVPFHRQVQDAALLQKVLGQMQAAERGLRRLDVALDKTGPDQLAAILRSVNLKSLDQVDNLETLRKIVLTLEAKAGPTATHV
jgi:hypothetical protein